MTHSVYCEARTVATNRRGEQLSLFSQPAEVKPFEPAAPERQPFHCFESSVVALGLVRGVGHVTVKAMVDAFDGDLRKVWEASAECLAEIMAKARTPAAAMLVELIKKSGVDLLEAGKQGLENLERHDVHVLQRNRLPERLATIKDDPPRWLFIQGNVEAMTRGPYVAVVGTRQATDEGIEATKRICKVIARYPEITLVSGLADGIDATAHATSVAFGTRNVAFLGHGIDHVFPASTAGERQSIIKNGGAVVTEYLPDEKFQKAFFVRRNRLQAALADLVIPVQAESKSGTAHTVNYAKAYDRKLVGVRWPGSTGVVDELQRDGFPIINIFDDAGVKKLDGIFRALIESFGAEVYPFSQTEKMFFKELKTRMVRAKDLDRLMHTIATASDESREECPLPESFSTIPSSSDGDPKSPPS
jgi:DNA processing protein